LSTAPQYIWDFINKDFPVTEDSASDSATIATIDSKIEKARSQLKSYIYLKPGWDGYSGKTFPILMVDSALTLLTSIKKLMGHHQIVPDRVIPGPVSDGTIDIEIKVGGKELLFTIQSLNRISYCYEDPELNVQEEDDLGQTSLAEQFNRLRG